MIAMFWLFSQAKPWKKTRNIASLWILYRCCHVDGLELGLQDKENRREKRRGNEKRGKDGVRGPREMEGDKSISFILILVYISKVNWILHIFSMNAESTLLQEVSWGEAEHKSQSRARKLAQHSTAPPLWDLLFLSQISHSNSQNVWDKACLGLVLYNILCCIYSHKSLSKEDPAAKLNKHFLREYEKIQVIWFI